MIPTSLKLYKLNSFSSSSSEISPDKLDELLAREASPTNGSFKGSGSSGLPIQI